MLLTIDVGNTQTVLGLYEADAAVSAADAGLVDHWRVRTDHDRTSELWPARRTWPNSCTARSSSSTSVPPSERCDDSMHGY